MQDPSNLAHDVLLQHVTMAVASHAQAVAEGRAALARLAAERDEWRRRAEAAEAAAVAGQKDGRDALPALGLPDA